MTVLVYSLVGCLQTASQSKHYFPKSRRSGPFFPILLRVGMWFTCNTGRLICLHSIFPASPFSFLITEQYLLFVVYCPSVVVVSGGKVNSVPLLHLGQKWVYQALFLVNEITDYDAACMIRHFSHVRLCDTMDEACQGPLSMGFSRQQYWSGLPFTPSGIMTLTAYISLCNGLIWRNKILAPIPTLNTNQVS